MVKTIEIAVENARKYYVPGDVIKGQVIFQCDSDEPVRKVTISMIGVSKTKLIRNNGQNRSVYRGRSPLVVDTVVVFQGDYTLKANRYTWPFEFVVPAENAVFTVGEDYGGTAGNIYRSAGENFPLPPSFNRYAGGRNKGKVEYRLEAAVEKPSSNPFSSGTATEVIFDFHQRRPHPEPDSGLVFAERMLMTRSPRLLPDKKELTLKEKVHTLLGTGDLPSANMVIRSMFPTQLWAGQPIPIHFSISAVQCSESLEKVAIPVYLRSISVEVKAYYQFRAPTVWGTRSGEQTERYPLLNTEFVDDKIIPTAIIEGKTERTLLSQSAESSSAPSDVLDLSSLAPRMVMPSIVASFHTQNISVTHRLKIKTKVECAEKKTTFEISDPINIWSQIPGQNPAVPSGAASADTELPAYSPNAAGILVERGEDADDNAPPGYAQAVSEDKKRQANQVGDVKSTSTLND